MITIETTVHVAGLRGREVSDFLLHPTDAQYRRWWPGTHLRFHTLRGLAGRVGSAILMDEFVGRRRLRMAGLLREVVPGERIRWQFRFGVPLPAWLRLDLADDEAGVTIRHTVRAGFAGLGRFLDPLLRRYFTPAFTRDLDAHVREEFPRLRDLLAEDRRAA